MASAERPAISGTRCLTNAAFDGSLTAMLASGITFPRASPISRASRASRKRSLYGGSKHLVQAIERTHVADSGKHEDEHETRAQSLNSADDLGHAGFSNCVGEEQQPKDREDYSDRSEFFGSAVAVKLFGHLRSYHASPRCAEQAAFPAALSVTGSGSDLV